MFQPNAVIAGRYQVDRLIGQGGMSNLYLAYDRKYANATVVIKEMTASYADPNEQQMAVDLFHREAKLLASLNHRHIPKVFDYFQFAGKYYLSMEYIDGVDLAVKLEEKKGPLPEEQVLRWGSEIATVLFYLHKHEPPIVFRDVKPSNIMISSQGVKLIDFGIARHFDQAKKGDTMRIGSPGYAPPEQYAAQTDPRSDIYALGVTLHHALTGRDPTATSTPFLVPPARDINPALSEATAAMLARATQLDPSDRYQSALELKKDIKHILDRNKQSTRVVGAPPSLPPEAQTQSADTPAPTQAQAQTPDPSAPKAPVQASAPATGQPAQIAQAAQAPQASPSAGTPAASNPASGSLTNQPATGTASGPLKSANQPQKKKTISAKRLLLVACVFLFSAGAAALVTMPSEQRDNLVLKVKGRAESLIASLYTQDNPEDRLRDSLMSGSPEALLPLFQSPDFKELSKEKQELFRLNLLALSSNQGPLKILHVLTPEGQDAKDLWRVAAQVVKTVNGNGGLERELLVVVPESYKPGSLEQTLQKLKKQDNSSLSQAFLVVDGEREAVPADAPANLLFLAPNESPDRNTVPDLSSDSVNYEKVYGIGPQSTPTVWALPGPVPTQAIASDTPLTQPLSSELLEKLFDQANEAGGRVIMLAEDGEALSNSESTGDVLLLSPTPASLPDLGKNLQGRAALLASPFEQFDESNSVHPRPLESTELNLGEARIFDAIVLATLPVEETFQGLTLTRPSSGSYQAKTPTYYRWDGSHWLPDLEESGKKQ